MELCYRGDMKNITVSVPDDVYRRARIRAAVQGRSLSSLVAEFLQSLQEDPGERFARLEALQRKVQSEVANFRASDRLSRDQVHDRALR